MLNLGDLTQCVVKLKRSDLSISLSLNNKQSRECRFERSDLFNSVPKQPFFKKCQSLREGVEVVY
ncbi:MAG: hypothetical protein L6275_00760 [Candidatus Portnoybacteria bacterium]|nr:hypothetical protein [Candidatus Portnoybacteria bacterium]